MVCKVTLLVASISQPQTLSNRLLDDLGERWMDVENAGGHLVDCVPEAHRLDERLDEDRGLRADDVSPEQQAGRGVGEDLHETRRVLQRPAVGGVAVRACRGDVTPSLCLQVLLRDASRGDLRIGEHGGRHDREGSLPGLAGVRNVVPDDPRLGVLPCA